MARLTLNGMFEYDPTIFDGMILPQDYDRDALLMEIMDKCGQLYPYHQQPIVLKSAIRLWFSRNYLNFDRIMEALLSEYDPIENYNRHENWTRTPNLDDTETRSGTDTTAHSGDDTESHTGTDSVELGGKDTVALSGKDTVALSGKDTVALSGKDTVADSGTDTTTRTYTNYHETITNTGSKTTEEQVSAFDSSVYEPSKKTIETPAALNEDKTITGSYADALLHGKSEDTTYGKSEDTTYGKSEDTTYGKSEDTTYGKTEDTTYDSEVKNEYNSSEATTYGTTFKHAHTGNEQYASHIHGNIGVTTSQQMIQSELELRQFDVYTDIARRFEREFIVQVY